MVDFAHKQLLISLKRSGTNFQVTTQRELAEWFRASCDSGSLVRYLETFAHTVAVMQRREDIVRVARECAVDLARDGVVYAEVRMAPELLTEKGLTLSAAIEAILEGFSAGEKEAKTEGNTIRVTLLLCGMRQNQLSQEVAELAVKYREKALLASILQVQKMDSPK
jgi:adenosine deaminase